MPPEVATPDMRSEGRSVRLSRGWREALATLVLASIALLAMAAREWGEMFHQWWNIDTYTHILLVPLIVIWLVAAKASELAKVMPRAWLPGIAIVATGIGLWAIGRLTELNLVAHAGAVGMLQGVVIAVLGPRASMIIALPLCFAVFLVPFGDELIPQLQAVTADIAVALTMWSGIPAVIDGIYIDTPVGLFIVAEACSGVKFLVAMVTLAVLVCFTQFESWQRRAAFMLTSIIVPIVANGIRAWGTIYIAQSQGVEFAAGFDHIFYGWIFFALVVALVLGAAWRFFECEPEDYGWTSEEVARFAWVERLEQASVAPIVVLAGVIALALLEGIAVLIVDPVSLG